MAGYDAETALLVVDIQNDFADPSGSLYVSGAAPVVERANEEIRRAAAAGGFVVYTRDWHPPHTPHFEPDGGVWPVHCVAGTWGAEFHPALVVVEGAEEVHKGTGGEDGYSAFSVRDPGTGAVSPTGLDDVLARHRATRLVVVGLATDYCVKETVLDARRRGLPVTVVGEAVAAVDLTAGDGDRALDDMRVAGAELA